MSDGSMGDAGGGGGDFGSGYAGYGTGGKLSAYLMAIMGLVGAVGVLVYAPSAWGLAALFFVSAALTLFFAHAGPKFQAWNEQRLKRKPGEEPTMHDLE